MVEPEAIGLHGAPAEEHRLLLGLQEASPEAVRELCDRFGPKLHWFAAARLFGDAQTAEEVVVEALADAARNIRQFNPRKSTLSAWLYGIARRKIRGELRKQRWRKSVPPSAQVPLDEATDTADGRDLAEALTSRLEAQRQVAAVAQALSDLEFEVLTLSCIDQLSAREIGQAVGRSERAIHSLLHRARQKARERLANDEAR
jgi:RNA polymerase sigma-70 factor (ECF subfamily)